MISLINLMELEKPGGMIARSVLVMANLRGLWVTR